MSALNEATPCRACPLQDCSGLRPLGNTQLEFIEKFKAGEVGIDRGETVISQGSSIAHLYTVLEGVMIRHRTLEDGRRQIVNFMFPGDFLGIQSAFDEPATHSIEALLDARLCVFERNRFVNLITAHPRLGYDMIWLTAKEETVLEEHIVSLGLRTAKERVSYLAMWLVDRGLATGMATTGNVLKLPITQAQIADMLGLSLVHTNRTIRALAREKLVDWTSREIVIPDLDQTAQFAHFERKSGQVRPFV